MKRARGPLLILAVGAVACLLLEYWAHARNEFFVVIGNRNLSGGWEGLWSGFFGAIQPSLLGAGVLVWYHHTCHDHPLCLRWGKYEAAGGIFKVCRHHHPDLRGHTGTRRELIHRLHSEWKSRQ